jgi:hypothetical protein
MVGDPWEWIAALDLKFTSPLACAFTLLFRFDTQVALLHEMAHATYLGLTVQEPRLLANGDMLSAGVWVPSPCTGIIRSLELFYEKIPPAYTN